MYRVAAHRFGCPEEVLTFGPATRPETEPGSALVRMQASPINPSDLIPVTGAYRHRTPLPYVPGYDGVGIVEAVGEGVDRAMIGRRVLPLGSGGNWQSYKSVPAEWCVTVPDDLTEDQAATAYVNPLTARLMVRALKIRPGDRVGITAAASTIGRMLIRMLADAGAEPVAIVRSAYSREALRDEPASLVLEQGMTLPMLAAGMDAVGGTAGAGLAAAVRPGGPFLHYGLLSGRPITSAMLGDARPDLRLFLLRQWVHAAPRPVLHNEMEKVFDDIRIGRATSPIARRYRLCEIRQALAYDARRGRRGKVILDLR